MSPLILVDGPLSQFRTHVAHTLAEDYVTLHDKGRVDTTPEMYVRMMAPAIDSQRPVVIECSWVTQERHAHLLKPIQQEVFRRHRAQRRMLDRLALGSNALCVLVLDEDAPLQSEWCTPELVTVLNTLPVTSGEVTGLSYARKCTENPGPGIGYWGPNEVVLLVGDQHGDTIQPYNVHRNIAFCSMSGKGCSEWLTDQLDKANISERSLYWINAREPKPGGGRATQWDFLDELNPKAIVAMGDMAGSWCVSSGRPYFKVPHPQSWKRFHYYEPYPLIAILKEVLSDSNSA